MKLTILSLCLLAIISFSASCGIKPRDVDPPANSGGEVFPKTYPDISTDPAP